MSRQDKNKKEDKFLSKKTFRLRREQLNYRTLKELEEKGVELTAPQIATSLTFAIRKNGSYTVCEKLFIKLEKCLQKRVSSQPNYEFDTKEIMSFEIATSTLVRYAPTIDLARKYFLITFQKYKALPRSTTLELCLLTNLMSSYYDARFPNTSNLNDALELVQMGLDIGVYRIGFPKIASISKSFVDPLEDFEKVAK